MEKYSRDNLPEGVAADFCEYKRMPGGENMSPKMAINDYINEFVNLSTVVSLAEEEGINPMDLFIKYNWKKCRKFSERFPQDRFPGLLASQNQSDIKALDELVDEVNLWFAAGELTVERVRDICSRAAAITGKYNFLS